MRINKITKILVVLVMSFVMITGCSNNISSSNHDKISIVCTTFPQYDWVSQITRGKEDEFNLTLLMENGTDLHNYQPTARDIINISDADVFIYVGGESDGWVEDALKEAKNQDMKVINLMEVLGDKVKEEDIIEGMQEEDNEDGHEEDHEEVEYDEHIWLSLKNTQILVKEIAHTLSELYSDYSSIFIDNSNVYISQLSELDIEYKDMVSLAKRKVVLFGDRFPFRYLFDDYGIEYYAAFPGCSAETEASFETIAFLSQKLDEKKLPVVLVIENSDEKIAKAVINNSEQRNQEVLILSSLQSIKKSDIDNGVSYLSIMTNNLNILKKALN